jgi:hypothetical protein
VLDMAEQKKKGFAALEQRIHEMEEEDNKQERESKESGGQASRQDQRQSEQRPRK